MPLFKCSACGCCENTALSNWAWRRMHKQPPLCSECDPEIGKWHGEFEKRPFTQDDDKHSGMPREMR